MGTLEFNNRLVSARSGLSMIARNLTQNPDEANDLVQETMLKALSYRDKYANNVNFEGWLYTIMRNTHINNHKKMSRNYEHSRDSQTDLTMNRAIATAFAGPEQSINMKELESQLAKLEDVYKKPFLMYFEGYKYKEIADELEIPIGTVKTFIHIARKKLMKQIRKVNAEMN